MHGLTRTCASGAAALLGPAAAPAAGGWARSPAAVAIACGSGCSGLSRRKSAAFALATSSSFSRAVARPGRVPAALAAVMERSSCACCSGVRLLRGMGSRRVLTQA